MAIQFDKQTISLHTENTTYQMQIGTYGHLLHTYYGPSAQGDLSFGLVFRDHGFSGTPWEAGAARDYSLDVLPQEYPCVGTGDFRHSAFVLRRSEGPVGCDLRYHSHCIEPGKYALSGLPAVHSAGAQTLRVTLKDESIGISVELLYGVLPELDVITRAAVITNEGDQELVVQNAASVNLDLLGGDWDLLHFQGRHMGERTPERLPVTHTETIIGSRRGTSSHQHNPFVILCSRETGEDFGTAIGVSLLWSGGFACCAARDQYDQTRLTLGLCPEGLDYLLMPGEHLTTPEAAFCRTERGFSEVSHHFHTLTRDHICRGPWAHRRRPVLLNNWEATYMDFTGEKLLAIAQEASELGVELFVLDDGWFGARNSDNAGLGDWYVNERKLGMTMGELSRRVNAMGMDFGLWIEPEMVNPDSDLYRAHPDWALQIPGKAPVLGRSQLVLDFSRGEVVDAIFDRLCAVLDNASVCYIKMDMNRSLCERYSAAMGRQSSGMVEYRYVLGVYRFLERLLQRYPGLLLEGCSGGGGRFDHGMLYYCPQIWCSDNTDAIERTRIQHGTSFGYPVSAMGSHVSAVPNHQTGRITPLQTRGVVAMSGAFGYELDLKLLSSEEKDQVRQQIQDYQRYADLLHNGRCYRLSTPNAAAWIMVREDRSEALLNVVNLKTNGNDSVIRICCRGLDPSALYRDEDGRQYSGAALMSMGLVMPWGEYRATQMHLLRM